MINANDFRVDITGLLISIIHTPSGMELSANKQPDERTVEVVMKLTVRIIIQLIEDSKKGT